MADMLVKLYELPPLQPALDALAAINIEIRPARPGEEYAIAPWVERHFQPAWAYGVAYAVHRNPSKLYIAVEKQPPDPQRANLYHLPDEGLVGFAGYDISNLGAFGPLGVQESHRRRGIGRALLLACLHAMWSEGYAYAVIGWAGPVDWYKKVVNATIIPDSEPGPFRGKLVGR